MAGLRRFTGFLFFDGLRQSFEHSEHASIAEAQDLSLAMVRMLHSLVGDQADAFTLIGDGQQSIYPGGYVLSEAGIRSPGAASCST